jgi:transcription antitermination protein NusB
VSSRSKSRKLALDVIFASDLRKNNPIDILEQIVLETSDRQNQDAIVGYARQIIQGVIDNHAEIDDRIAGFSHKWSIERMPAVDRAILRVGCWEILFNDEVPEAVAISEAVELAKEFSTEESGSFVNGLLGAIAATKLAR